MREKERRRPGPPAAMSAGKRGAHKVWPRLSWRRNASRGGWDVTLTARRKPPLRERALSKCCVGLPSVAPGSMVCALGSAWGACVLLCEALG